MFVPRKFYYVEKVPLGTILRLSIVLWVFVLGESGVISTTRVIRPVDCLSLININ